MLSVVTQMSCSRREDAPWAMELSTRIGTLLAGGPRVLGKAS